MSSFGDLATDAGLSALNDHLSLNSYVYGFSPSSADAECFDKLSLRPDAAKFPHVARWFSHIRSFGREEIASFPKPVKAKKATNPFERRDKLLAIQAEVQNKWQEKKVFECNVPKNRSEPKYFGCFPYPYMNGKLHLGHTFTLSKVEFAMGFQRMLGKNAFFPFAFHCTGMPIQACANKLKAEIAEFGCPPVFPEAGAAKSNAKNMKSKIAAKTGGLSRQWMIMESLGFSATEIPAFQDPLHWLNFFPPVAMDDLKLLGCKVDWRRSFITTEANPYYDSFIRWQFWTMKALEKVKFGKRYAVWSPKDGQPCADHDRASGEGHQAQEYTIVKMRMLEPYPKPLQGAVGDLPVYLAAATLRPETMYGQTNCWIHPDGEYGAFKVNDGKEVFVLTERAAHNMAFQGKSKEWGKIECLAKVSGMDLIGCRSKSPHCAYDAIYTLPMMNVDVKKTTGVVTSVPSDSPDDYATLQDLKNKEAFRNKYGIKDEWVFPFEPSHIIDVEGEGPMYAVQVCKEMKIQSQNDREQLHLAHDLVYKRGFHMGKMAVGKYKGQSVESAKPLIRQDMLDAGLADTYAEPAGEVVSRSGDVCVVAHCDQWYLDYGEESWLASTKEALDGVNCHHDEVFNQFVATLGWLNQWACSREFGLGTKLPWDPKWLIESLSDSTIYMAYYTVAHLLQGNMFGTEPGPLGITPDQLTPAVWDYIMLGKPYPADQPACPIAQDKLDQMRSELTYWYPVDLRVSGKDLIQNHLTFFLYNHVAMFPKEMWPKGIRCNGHLLLNNEKMSKSTGNFMTQRQSVESYSADATRLALADAGDGVDDANFVSKTADSAILRLTTLVDVCKSFMAGKDKVRDVKPDAWNFLDRWFDAMLTKAVKVTKAHYEKSLFREALCTGFFDLSKSYGIYTTALAGTPPAKNLVTKYLDLQVLMLTPITPHTCEHMWEILGHKSFIVSEPWPELGDVDEQLIEEGDYLFSTARDLRLSLNKAKKPKKGQAMKPTKLTLYVAKEYPQWQKRMLVILQGLYDKATSTPPAKAQYVKAISGDAELKPNMKKIMGVAAYAVDQCKVKGFAALQTELPFDEADVLSRNLAYLSQTLEGVKVSVVRVSDAGSCPDTHKSQRDSALPLKPGSVFEQE